MTESSKPPSGRRMKVHAPPPPQAPQPAPRHLFRSSIPDGGGTSDFDTKENLLKPTVDFQLTLPKGHQIYVREDGSKALMDLLVELCSRHQLNPGLHTLELLSPEGHPLGFKPNALLGSLCVASVLIKEKVTEEKVTRRPAPKVPEKTVRLMVNYHGNQKAVVRVNPLVPLQALIPVICDKCDFDPAHVLLVKDGIGRHELPLDKSLTELGIKELYVHDQSLVFQPKMASAPALNYSDSICSSTTSLEKTQKKGLLNIFQFSKRKTKTEMRRSVDMDDFDDRIQNTDTNFNGLSTVSGAPNMEFRSSCLGQSQSVTDIPRMSDRTDTKKRRAPEPPGAPATNQGQTTFKNNQVGLGSESQRKRKAPAPPPTPTSITQDSDTSAPAPLTPDLCAITGEIPTPVRRNQVGQSVAVCDTSVVVQTKPSPRKRTPQPPPVSNETPTPSSPSPSSSTTDSMAVQDSSSELSRSLDDSDVDLERAGSCCSTSSTASGSAQVSHNSPGQKNEDVNPDSSSRSDPETALNLKLDEVENNRHSGMAWLHSTKSSSSSVQKRETAAPEAETLSLDSSSVGSSLPDQGYAPSEGVAEGEDSGIISSPSDTQPTSPDGSLSVNGRSEDRGEKLPEHQRDISSDSDEGCATWRPKQRQKDTSPQEQSVNSFKDDSELTAQLHQTLADLEADLADQTDTVSTKHTLFTKSIDRSDVPVSVVDMYVPVTAIDEVLEDYEQHIVEHEMKPLIKSESAGSSDPGLCQKSDVEPQNKNNNAFTAAVSYRKSSANAKESEKSNKPQENKSTGVNMEEKTQERSMKAMSNIDTNFVNDDKKSLAIKSNADIQKISKITEISPDLVQSTDQKFQQQKWNLSPVSLQPRPSENNGEIQRASKISSSFSSSHGKITHNGTSRFGMKTFTVVPPKPSTMHAALTQSAVTVGTGAIKIDDQGNMVTAGISHSKVSRPSKSETTEGVPLCEKAKAFWSSNERQEHAVTQRKGLTDNVKDGSNGLSSAPTTVGLEAKLSNVNTDYQRTMQSGVSESVKTVQPKVVVEKEAKELVKDVTVTNKKWIEMENKSSVSNNVHLPSKPAVPPPLPSDLKKQLNFLKPSRRTSSQYVASAIAKYTPKTSAKPTSVPKISDSSESFKTQAAAGFQKSGPSKQETPLWSSQSSLSDNNTSAPIPPGPSRSMIRPEAISDSQRDLGRVTSNKERSQTRSASTKESSGVLDSETAKNNHSQHNGSTQKSMTANDNREYIKHVQHRSSSPPKSSTLHSPSRPPIAPKITSQDLTSDTSKDVKPPSSSTASDSDVGPGPVAVTVFGPVKKFKPVICRSVEKETSLHSSLMEAIQTSGGRDRLKKITSSPINSRKVTYVEEENERSALLSAIRAENNISRLKKTNCETAGELEQLRKMTSEQERSADSSPSPPSQTSFSPGFTSPPSPPTSRPPPPPPLVSQGKPKPNSPMNPASAREAMLEAIRSGAGAERLKKVSVPTKTVQVNGRLGTIQAKSSTVSQQ